MSNAEIRVVVSDRPHGALGMKVIQREDSAWCKHYSGEINAEKRSNQVEHSANNWARAASFFESGEGRAK